MKSMPGTRVQSVNLPTLRKYQKVVRRSKREYLPYCSFFITITIVIGILIFFVWSRLQITYLGYQISQANNQQQQLLKLNTQMKLEIASLKSLSRIERIAKNKLGLTDPQPHQMVFMK